jgi:hypothetical protein
LYHPAADPGGAVQELNLRDAALASQ